MLANTSKLVTPTPWLHVWSLSNVTFSNMVCSDPASYTIHDEVTEEDAVEKQVSMEPSTALCADAVFDTEEL